MAKGDDIQERLIDFAVDIIAFTSRLPKTQAGNHIAGQLLRSGTAPAPITLKQEALKVQKILFIN